MSCRFYSPFSERSPATIQRTHFIPQFLQPVGGWGFACDDALGLHCHKILRTCRIGTTPAQFPRMLRSAIFGIGGEKYLPIATENHLNTMKAEVRKGPYYCALKTIFSALWISGLFLRPKRPIQSPGAKPAEH